MEVNIKDNKWAKDQLHFALRELGLSPWPSDVKKIAMDCEKRACEIITQCD